MSGAHRRERTGIRRRATLVSAGAAVTGLVTAAAVVAFANEPAGRQDVPAAPVVDVAATQELPPSAATGADAPGAPRVPTGPTFDPRLAEPSPRPESKASPSRGRPSETPALSSATSTRPAPEAPRLPEDGSGEFLVAPGQTPAAGVGTLTTYTVEVEAEVPVEVQGAAGVVDQVLADPRGWTATGAHALARVEVGSDIRVLVATPETTDALCAPLDTGGRLSCRNGDLVVLNAWRWLNGAPAYAGNLRDYRRYLISHEVGHALGNPHVACPGPGRLAPVMMQQTKGLGECVANPWPSP